MVEVGVDEAGRGPLAFDVVSAAVIMPSEYDEDDEMVKQIKDSKKVSAKKREKLAEYIKHKAIAYGIGISTVDEIDTINILKATYKAMHRALDQVYAKKPFDMIRVDGNAFAAYIPPSDDASWVKFECVIDGDNNYLNIAAASILAKTYRDSVVKKLAEERPDLDEKYCFSKNMGYGTAKHMEGLRKHGPCEYHRKSYAPVQRYMKD